MKTSCKIAVIAGILCASVACAQNNANRSNERSAETSSSQKQSSEKKRSSSAARTMSMNAVLLDTYIQNFELERQFEEIPIPTETKEAQQEATQQANQAQLTKNLDALDAPFKKCKAENPDDPKKCWAEQMARDKLVTDARVRALNSPEVIACEKKDPGNRTWSISCIDNYLNPNQAPAPAPRETVKVARRGQAGEAAFYTKILSNPMTAFPAFDGFGTKPLQVVQREFTGLQHNYSPPFNIQDPVVRRYLLAASFANIVLSSAAAKLEQTGVTGSPEDAALKAMASIDFEKAAVQAWEQLQKVSMCAGQYPHMDVKGGIIGDLALRCGPINIDLQSRQISINGRPTLSQETIDGRKIEVAVNDERSNTTSKEKSKSTSTKSSSGTQKTWQTQGAEK